MRFGVKRSGEPKLFPVWQRGRGGKKPNGTGRGQSRPFSLYGGRGEAVGGRRVVERHGERSEPTIFLCGGGGERPDDTGKDEAETSASAWSSGQ